MNHQLVTPKAIKEVNTTHIISHQHLLQNVSTPAFPLALIRLPTTMPQAVCQHQLANATTPDRRTRTPDPDPNPVPVLRTILHPFPSPLPLPPPPASSLSFSLSLSLPPPTPSPIPSPICPKRGRVTTLLFHVPTSHFFFDIGVGLGGYAEKESFQGDTGVVGVRVVFARWRDPCRSPTPPPPPPPNPLSSSPAPRPCARTPPRFTGVSSLSLPLSLSSSISTGGTSPGLWSGVGNGELPRDTGVRSPDITFG